MSAKVNDQVLGGVLSDGAIRDEVAAGRLIVKGFQMESLKPASYDVTVAQDGLIDPNEREIEPDAERKQNRVVLHPGDAAMFSTRETFCMPRAIAGNITIKNRLATEGLMLLSGGLIDPGYGQSTERNRDLIGVVIVGGIFVLFMTMISVALAVILSLSADGKLVSAAKAAVPQTTSGRWLWAALVFGLSVLALSSILTLLLRVTRGQRPRLRSRLQALCRCFSALRRRART